MRMYNATAIASGSLIGGAVSTSDEGIYVREGDVVKYYSLVDGTSGNAPYEGDFAPVCGGVVRIQNGGLTYESE